MNKLNQPENGQQKHGGFQDCFQLIEQAVAPALLLISFN